MNATLVNILIVLVLILIEGVFVAAEIALVSLRDGQIRAMAASGTRRGAAVARLTAEPNRFLAAVQIGVTSTALLSSAFGAVTLSEDAKRFLVGHGWSEALASAAGVIGVTLIISFVTLVVGELAPKRLALQRNEGASQLFAPPLNGVATAFRPIIWLLSVCTDAVVRVLGGDPHADREPISDEELRGLVAAHESLSREDRRLIDEVFAAGDRAVDQVMVPRTDVVFLEAAMPLGRAAKMVAESTHSRYPVIGHGSDDVRGFVHIRDVLVRHGRTSSAATVGDITRPMKVFPGTKPVLAALSEMRREGFHIAIVVDEYGGTDGIVTLEDLIEEVVGEIHDEYDEPVDEALHLGGDVEVDGKLNLDEVEEESGLRLPEGPYLTLGGYVMAALGRLPRERDEVTVEGHRLVVTEIDGRRIARVLIHPAEATAVTAADTGSDAGSDTDAVASAGPDAGPDTDAVAGPDDASGGRDPGDRPEDRDAPGASGAAARPGRPSTAAEV